MARFRVYGADAQTGKDRSETITADAPEDARAVANSRGLLVREVIEQSNEAPAGGGLIATVNQIIIIATGIVLALTILMVFLGELG